MAGPSRTPTCRPGEAPHWLRVLTQPRSRRRSSAPSPATRMAFGPAPSPPTGDASPRPAMTKPQALGRRHGSWRPPSRPHEAGQRLRLLPRRAAQSSRAATTRPSGSGTRDTGAASGPSRVTRMRSLPAPSPPTAGRIVSAAMTRPSSSGTRTRRPCCADPGGPHRHGHAPAPSPPTGGPSSRPARTRPSSSGTPDGRLCATLAGHTDAGHRLRLLPRRATASSRRAGQDPQALGRRGRESSVTTLDGPPPAGHRLRLLAGRAALVSASDDKTLKLWDARTGGCVSPWRATRQGLRLRLLPRRAAHRLGQRGRDPQALGRPHGRGAPPWTATRAASSGCAFSPDGRPIVSASDGTLRLWDAATGVCERDPRGPHRPGRRLRLLPGRGARSSRRAGTGLSGSGTPARGKTLVPSAGHRTGSSPAPSRRTGRLSSRGAGRDPQALGRAHRGGASHPGRAHDEVTACAFSPDGRQDRLGQRGRDPQALGRRTGEEHARLTLAGHRLGSDACAFSPDGRTIVSASRDKTLKLWDADAGAASRPSRRTMTRSPPAPSPPTGGPSSREQ